VGGPGVLGKANTGAGVSGQSVGLSDKNSPPLPAGDGVLGEGLNGVHGVARGNRGAGVWGENTSAGAGVQGTSASGDGVVGESIQAGVRGHSVSGTGVVGVSDANKALGLLGGIDAVFQQHTGVYGESDTQGVFGNSTSATGTGIYGIANSGSGFGVRGDSKDGIAVQGQCFGAGTGVKGITNGSGAAVVAVNQSASGAVPSIALQAPPNGTGVYALGNPAGYFVGDVQVTGDLILINSPASGDVSEDFDLADDDPIHAEPGTVLVINASGKLCASVDPYDTRVAGVVSGAGEFRPAVVLQRIKTAARRSPIALIGKTFCKVDADFGSIAGGDLLTTSTTLGHAMKVTDRSKAFGTILGKALGTLERGRGLIPILVSLR